MIKLYEKQTSGQFELLLTLGNQNQLPSSWSISLLSNPDKILTSSGWREDGHPQIYTHDTDAPKGELRFLIENDHAVYIDGGMLQITLVFADGKKTSHKFRALTNIPLWDGSPLGGTPIKNNEHEAIIRDNNAWNASQKANTLDVYNDYLKEFPNGAHREQAQQFISDILTGTVAERNSAQQAEIDAWGPAIDANSVQDYQMYLDTHPDGKHVSGTQAKIKALAPNKKRRVLVWTVGGLFLIGALASYWVLKQQRIEKDIAVLAAKDVREEAIIEDEKEPLVTVVPTPPLKPEPEMPTYRKLTADLRQKACQNGFYPTGIAPPQPPIACSDQLEAVDKTHRTFRIYPLRNDLDISGTNSLRIRDCDAPKFGSVKIVGHSILYEVIEQESSASNKSISFYCSIQNTEGLTDRALVSVILPPSGTYSVETVRDLKNLAGNLENVYLLNDGSFHRIVSAQSGFDFSQAKSISDNQIAANVLLEKAHNGFEARTINFRTGLSLDFPIGGNPTITALPEGLNVDLEIGTEFKNGGSFLNKFRQQQNFFNYLIDHWTAENIRFTIMLDGKQSTITIPSALFRTPK
ncbi:TPA: hypothetical protein EYP66_05920 [Candidatus Poribacteria bacterium]|nr:hypothetical protein [Candidatus Poribacteria bacterium]